jgi:hypothetical protein
LRTYNLTGVPEEALQEESAHGEIAAGQAFVAAATGKVILTTDELGGY